MKLLGKRALVVGGTSGIGLAVAKTFLAEGVCVTVGSRTRARLDGALGVLGKQACAVQVDISNETSVRQLFSDIGALDILVVTAATRGSGSLVQLSTEMIDSILRVKLYGTLWAAKYGSATMNEGGSIITFSGVWGHRPPPGFIAGAAVNGAVEALTRALAVELAAKGIRVNCIAPGITKTNRYIDEQSPQMRGHLTTIPLRRFAYPDEIAQAALFLVTNTYITGTVLFLDGGSMVTWHRTED